jgi:hypothetical protein
MDMKQPVFGSHRTLGTDLVKLAGPAAEGFQAVYPYNPNSTDPEWLQFKVRYEAKYHQQPDHFSALAYDQMNILLQAICKAGLNRGMIRDALYDTLTYNGVTGAMQFDPNNKQLRQMCLGTVHDGKIDYRKISMQKEYARVGEDGVQFAGRPKVTFRVQPSRSGCLDHRPTSSSVHSRCPIAVTGSGNSSEFRPTCPGARHQTSWFALCTTRMSSMIALDRATWLNRLSEGICAGPSPFVRPDADLN